MIEYDVNSIFYWWPIVKTLKVPVPKTTLIPYDGTIFLDNEEAKPEFMAFVDEVGTVTDGYGYPVFIKCGGLSGKHQWRNTCFLERREDLSAHIYAIIEEVLMIMGIRLDFDGIAVRELLELESAFTAFSGKMPVSKEFRFFARDGDYLCHHPYQPPNSIRSPSIDDWYEVLKKLQALEEWELDLLKEYTIAIATTLDEGALGYGYWSLDFCKTKDGIWYLTDLGTGNESYHWSTCLNASGEMMEHFGNPEDPDNIAEILGPTGREAYWKAIKERYFTRS